MSSAAAATGSGATVGAGHRTRAEKTTLIVEPHTHAHTSTVIFMHGLGDTAHGWIDVCADMFAPSMPNTKFVLPTARTRPVTINGGMPMPAWYDIESLAADRSAEMCDGIHDSTRVVRAIVDAEVAKGIAPEKIVLAGFSQGGAMSLFTGLNFPKRLGGLLVMSGYMPVPEEIKPTEDALSTPVLMLHGDADPIVPLAFGRDALARVKAFAVKEANMKIYRGLPHSAREDELADALNFLKTKLH